MSRLEQLWSNTTRIVAGLMSGTSLDGVDAVVARLSGSGRGMEVEILGFASVPYEDELREWIFRNSAAEGSSVRDLSQLNVRIAHAYRDAVLRAATAAGVAVSAIDLVGSHGQTVHHVPDPRACAGEPVTSTFQIGDPSVLANLLGVPVVGDFRVADMALGGQGAPLVPYFDYVYFSDAAETRGLLNIGGIANITVVPAGAASPEEVYAFDTGPGNMVVDALAQRLFGRAYDDGGRLAAGGRADETVLAGLLTEEYFVQSPPKSTGRERFGAAYVEHLIDRCREHLGDPSARDLVATAASLTALSVYQAYARFIRDRNALDVLVVSGGGMHNAYLMERLATSFAPIPVRTVEDYGLDSDAKEALCFAVLAHETLNGVPTNLPSVTGASRPTLLGKICLPC